MSFYVYIISNKKNGTIYIGYTNDLGKRMKQHKNGTGSRFAKRYALDKLVYYEKFKFPMSAIKREKQLKKWNRQWKINLINDFNPKWEDLTWFFE
ncbi:GIY-YIG nuclease family protein [Flagellimonas algicola]|uniref:GIY-YIG nuclease family protein n=1 Tax=Flagellimonas algicola TaxID=2583815 RepID=A0ABY2WGD2_9FLAO|nr:GIY-YIG nuclease family protein [Allomuricauda algicola]TMU50491.1 GIY-YIG nuclease family protein [Allomuricauda algicola]